MPSLSSVLLSIHRHTHTSFSINLLLTIQIQFFLVERACDKKGCAIAWLAVFIGVGGAVLIYAIVFFIQGRSLKSIPVYST